MTTHDTHDIDDDDLPVGQVFSRRETLALFGMSAAALLAGCGTVAAQSVQTGGVNAEAATAANPTTIASQVAAVATANTTNAANPAATMTGCVVRPEMTEGPYFVDEKLDRSDIRLDPSDGAMSAGAPLALTFNVQQVGGNTCASLVGAVVDIWQCDAAGRYSDVAGEGTAGKQFLRGSQTTDANGVAAFTTIYPGWYPGRAVHIHFKIRTTGAANEAYEFTSQLFFDETVNDAVLAQSPYSDHRGTRLRNSRDGIYAQGSGDQMLLVPAPTATGYAATFAVGLDLTNTSIGRADGNGGGGPGGFGGPPRR